MLINLLLSAFTYWFDNEVKIDWIKDEWTKPLWITLICIAALFILMIIVLFFRAIIRTRQRRLAREAAEEMAEAERERLREERAAEKAAEKERKRTEREAERARRQAEKEAEKAKKLAEREERRRAREEKKNRVDDETSTVEVVSSEPPIVAVIAEKEPVVEKTSVVEETVVVKAEEPEPIRELTGITVDSTIVQREFTVGDDFNCDGLLVKTEYNRAPFIETRVDYTLVDAAEFAMAMNGELSGIYVCRPDLSYAGKRAVRVCFEKKVAVYTISIAEKVVEKPVEKPVERPIERPVESHVTTAQLESAVVERIIGKIAEVPVDRVVERIVGALVEKIAEVPVEKLIRRVEVPVERIVEVPAPQPAPQPTPEPVVVERVVEKVVEVPVEKIVERPVETVVINEESVDAGRLRYDKSFEAKFIQSDDEVKHWYTEIKNVLLSYKGCKGRISWKRETFKAKKDVVAKLVFRGNTLCLFLPLNPQEFADNKEIEDASNLPVYEDTPVMIRLKNEKRKRMAITLIERVMMERGILHGAHQSEDFYLPYEGVVELINRGLIKREIKTVEDEAIFERDKEEE